MQYKLFVYHAMALCTILTFSSSNMCRAIPRKETNHCYDQNEIHTRSILTNQINLCTYYLNKAHQLQPQLKKIHNWKSIVNLRILRLEANNPTIFLPKLKFLEGLELNHLALQMFWWVIKENRGISPTILLEPKNEK